MQTAAPYPMGAPDKQREFAFQDEDFEALRTLVKQTTGINLTEAKRELVYGRVARRLRALRLPSFAAYRELLASGQSGEMVEFCNAVTTNLTSFFREPHHFDYLREQLLRPRLKDPRIPRRVRIWSAGCSSGEEPYTIAMTVREVIADESGWDIRILATDLDSEVLERARLGLYGEDRVRDLGERRLAKFFQLQRSDGAPRYRVAPSLSSLITFKQLNLMHPLPMQGPLDAIFCRNVVIYFDKDTQRDLFARMSTLQRPADLLFLGHSETLFRVSDAYTLIGKTIYRRGGTHG